MKDNPSAQAQYSSELKQKVEAIIKSREILKQQNEELEKRLQEAQRQMNELREKANDLSSTSNRSDEADAMGARIEVVSSENAILTQQIADLNKEVADLGEKNRALESQKGRITEDEMSRYLGNLLVEAKNTAQRVVNEANESVRSVKSEAADISMQVSTELGRLKKEIQDMRESVAGVIEGFNNKLDMLDRLVDASGTSLLQYQKQN